MIKPIKIGIVGLGKISRDQHLPAIQASEDFDIAFTADRAVRIDCAAPSFDSLKEALDAGMAFDAVALCTSPQPRFELFESLLDSGCAILLEKPPAASANQATRIKEIAESRRTPLMTAWHSQFAPGISVVKGWLQKNQLQSGIIEWRENHRTWHPGQGWLWQKGGYGVFDPGMNALSILTKVMARQWKVGDSIMTFPENSETPISADFTLFDESAKIDVAFEFHDKLDDVWNISLKSTSGSDLSLLRGGEIAMIDGRRVVMSEPDEYGAMYNHFAQLVRADRSEIDLGPLNLIEAVFQNAKISTAPGIQLEI